MLAKCRGMLALFITPSASSSLVFPFEMACSCSSNHGALSVLSQPYQLPWQPQTKLYGFCQLLFIVIDYSECTDGCVLIGIDLSCGFPQSYLMQMPVPTGKPAVHSILFAKRLTYK